jgi:16S rRNA (uracil1498-N3)-methyltransferase
VSHRFYLPDLRAPVLTGAEARHARQVLRLRPGDELTVFDGRGHEARCRLGDAGRLEILHHTTTPPLPCRVTLAQAITKKHMDWIIQKATELGVAAIVPLVTDRTIVRTAKPDRWREIALEACKQSGNNWLPEISPPATVADVVTGRFDLKLIAALTPGSVPLKQAVCSRRFQPAPAERALKGAGTDARVLLLIGPEGDFTPAEVARAQAAGCVPVSLGPLTLRAETAALYALSVLHHELQTG